MALFKSRQIQIKTILSYILTIMVIELVVGGSGRFLPIGPLTFRIFLYIFCILISVIILILRRNVDTYILSILIPFTILLLFSASIGVINGAPLQYIYDDIKPLLFFYNILFFSITIKSESEILDVIKLIKYSTLLMALVYLILVILIYFNYVNFLNFYYFIDSFGEITFRGEEGFFLYKGFLYLCIGFFFFIISDDRYSNVFAFILLISVVLTLTRGFILFTVAVYILYLIFFYRNKILSISIIFLVCITTIITLPIYLQAIGDKEESNLVRKIQVDEVLARTDSFNLFFGNGFGIGVPINPHHMEIAYLEIFCKQGIIGLIFWGALLLYIFILFVRLYKQNKNMKIIIPCFLSVLFIAFQSATNPFINNPIGLSMLLITIVIYNRLLVI